MKDESDEDEATALINCWTRMTDGSLIVDAHITWLDTKVSSLP